jgi:enolase-phosphatase E1
MQTTMSAISTVLLDIEGTTTPIDFVHRILFSYARVHFEEFLRTQWEEASVHADIELLRANHGADKESGQSPPEWRKDSVSAEQSSALNYILWLMDKDAKSAPLKSLQGKIWRQGYQNGELKSEVYSDVPRAFLRWSQQQRSICIFSSGSVLAQKLLFAHTASGDLSRFLKQYFDTEVGAKREPGSYRKIAAALGTDPSCVLFISDTPQELDAARTAKMETALCVRGPEAPASAEDHTIVRTFDVVLA